MEDDSWEGPLQQFRHEELRSNTCIRLVQIHAQLFRGDISCTLRIFESDTPNCPDYAALSYVWGDSTPTHTIYVNGLVYKVHQSLWDFLSHSRTKEHTEHTWIWTDLLCIDQGHHSEKNEQISRMGDIYSLAAYVISWLGSRGQTAEALRFLVKISDFDTRCISKSERDSFRFNFGNMFHAAYQLGIREPYWERVWIFQEVACARNCIVTSGDISVNLEDLLRKIKLAMDRPVLFNPGHHDLVSGAYQEYHSVSRIETLADLKTSIQRGKTMKFLELIEKTGFCRATRDQDMIYGLLGLACRLDPEFDPSALEVSQHKSLSDVYWDIVFTIIEGGSNTSIKRDLAALRSMLGILPPPRDHWKLKMGSRTRISCAETAWRVSDAAYSESIQAFLGISHGEHDALFIFRQEFQEAWNVMTTHIYDHENDVPGLQTRLGWSAFAGLSFTSSRDVGENISQAFENTLPLGWFCAAHSPDILRRTMHTAKHPIQSINWFKTPLPDNRRIPFHCSGAEHDGPRCELSLVLLRIEPLGVTCIVRSTDAVQIDFHCDCCDPSAYSFRSAYNARRF